VSSLASNRLIELTQENEVSPEGVSLDAIGKIEVTNQVRVDILTCLYSIEPSDVWWGVWFCAGLIMVRKLDDKLRQGLMKRLPVLLQCDEAHMRAESVHLLVALHSEFPDYRNWMLRALQDSSWTVRQNALLNCESFLRPKEIEPLLIFAKDPEAVEASMSGPWVYVLRDEALVRIELRVGRKFEHRRLSEILENRKTVYWWDWTPFLNWWNARKKRRWLQF
jgi:hypothetical protein